MRNLLKKSHDEPSERCLCLFAKHWRLGAVKTRLGADIGMQRAADLHRMFVRHLVTHIHPESGARQCRALVATSPDTAIEAVTPHCPGWQVIGQGEGDLGQRLQSMFQDQLSAAGQLIVIGADCPDLPRETLEMAWQRLETDDVVLGPAVDGGYYLLGLKGPWQPWMASLFREIPWSQSEVAAVTRQRVQHAQRRISELETRQDVDTLADLQRLITRLDQSAGSDSRSAELLAGITPLLPAPLAAALALAQPARSSS